MGGFTSGGIPGKSWREQEPHTEGTFREIGSSNGSGLGVRQLDFRATCPRLRYRVYKPEGVLFKLPSLTKKRKVGAPPKVCFFRAFPTVGIQSPIWALKSTSVTLMNLMKYIDQFDEGSGGLKLIVIIWVRWVNETLPSYPTLSQCHFHIFCDRNPNKWSVWLCQVAAMSKQVGDVCPEFDGRAVSWWNIFLCLCTTYGFVWLWSAVLCMHNKKIPVLHSFISLI